MIIAGRDARWKVNELRRRRRRFFPPKPNTCLQIWPRRRVLATVRPPKSVHFAPIAVICLKRSNLATGAGRPRPQTVAQLPTPSSAIGQSETETMTMCDRDRQLIWFFVIYASRNIISEHNQMSLMRELNWWFGVWGVYRNDCPCAGEIPAWSLMSRDHTWSIERLGLVHSVVRENGINSAVE